MDICGRSYDEEEQTERKKINKKINRFLYDISNKEIGLITILPLINGHLRTIQMLACRCKAFVIYQYLNNETIHNVIIE